jgi:Domain of unknown function (DUF4160)
MAGDLIPAPAGKDSDSQPFLVKVDGIWIHRGVPEKPIDWNRIVDDVREERTMRILGWSVRRQDPAGIDGPRESFYGLPVPTLSIFFGIEIRMYFRDHAPPHFHAFYHDNEVLIAIEALEVIRGALPRRALGLVLDWAELHRSELMENWKRAQQHLDLSNIEPLE